jgi:hypothetical protein
MMMMIGVVDDDDDDRCDLRDKTAVWQVIPRFVDGLQLLTVQGVTDLAMGTGFLGAWSYDGGPVLLSQGISPISANAATAASR